MNPPYDPYRPPAAPLDGPPAITPSTTDVPPGIIALLAQTRPWVKLMAVLCIVGAVLMVVAMLVGFTLGSRGPIRTEALVGLLPISLLLLLYVPPALFLWRYAAGIRQLESDRSFPALERAVLNQKSFWKYVGILAVVVIGLYAVGFLLLGLGGALSR